MKDKSTIQQKKFIKLLEEKKLHDPEKIVFTCSSYVSLEVEKPLLLKRLNFSSLTMNLNHANYVVNLELFHRDASFNLNINISFNFNINLRFY